MRLTLKQILDLSHLKSNQLTFETVCGTIYSRPLITGSYVGDVHMDVVGNGKPYARFTDMYDVRTLNGEPLAAQR